MSNAVTGQLYTDDDTNNDDDDDTNDGGQWHTMDQIMIA